MSTALHPCSAPVSGTGAAARVRLLHGALAGAWIHAGFLLRQKGCAIPARLAFVRAVRLRPDFISGWLGLALVARESGQFGEAEAHLRRAFALHPNCPETLLAWARLRLARRDFAGAHGWTRWALAQAPDDAEVHNTLGILLHDQGRFAEAVPEFERAEALGSFPAISNRGNSLLDLGRTDEALAAHQSAVDRDPAHAGARYNLALTQLRLGQWREGWRNYEARWRFREVHRQPRVFSQPRWRGELLDGEHVLLHAEQGLGDTVQFCRYAALVAARGGRPILQVQAPAARLLRSLAVVRAGLAEVVLLDDPPPPFDLECPLMSLPAVFGTTPETVPWAGPYLGPLPHASGFVPRPRLLSVGLCWAGNPRYKTDTQRSMRLPVLLPLLRTPGVFWVSLQKGPAADQIAELPSDVAVADGASHDSDLADAAATIAGLDAVVTTDTCIAHLAGAIGKPVFVLLPHLADWRWMQDASTTPWYPTARLLRQPSPGDWNSVLAASAEALKALSRT
ncbi:MAG TPA: tetratricopeptide repeat protein [Terracidiphilus sp.]|nr:tetratricopeptide repeat protein [Terracidiphilus sp.]